MLEQRQHALAEPVRLLEVRVAGEDELGDAEAGVLLDPVGDLGVAADQRRAGAAADQARRRPRGSARRSGRAGRRRRAARASAAGPPTRSGEARLDLADRLVVDPLEQPLGRAHASSAVSLVITCSRMPKRGVRPAAAASASIQRLLGHRGRRLAPGQVDVGVPRGDRARGLRRAAEVDVGDRVGQGGGAWPPRP